MYKALKWFESTYQSVLSCHVTLRECCEYFVTFECVCTRDIWGNKNICHVIIRKRCSNPIDFFFWFLYNRGTQSIHCHSVVFTLSKYWVFIIYQYFEQAHIVYNIYFQILHKRGHIKGNQYYLKNKTQIPEPILNDSNYFGKIYVIKTG